jgi:poly(A) polymerase
MYPQTVEVLKLFVKPDLSRLLTDIARFLTDEGITAYLVGGAVRDMLLERDTVDIDVAVGADASEVARRIAGLLGGRYVPLDAETGTSRVVLLENDFSQHHGRRYIDFSTLRGDILEDLALRDFTIDAMAIKLDASDNMLDTDRIIDPLNGRDDLRWNIMKAVDDNIFTADAARLLRAVRIAAELDFSIDVATEALISRDSRLITGVAGERIREELLRLLSLPGTGPRLIHMDKLGLLTAIFPELAPTRGVDQPKIHVWDVFDHSLQTVSTVEFLLREHDWEYAGEDVLSPVPWSNDLKAHFDGDVGSGSTRRSLLKLAALLHDIGKPQTKTIDDNGRARFLGHSQDGAATAVNILERLRFSKKEVNHIALLITYHLRPTQMSNEGLPTHRAIYRYFRDTGESGIDILFLCLADHLATRGSDLDLAGWRNHALMTTYVLKKRIEERELTRPSKLVDGHDLMQIFGLGPGREVGELLEAIREAQAAGEIESRQQALDYTKLLLTDRAKSGTADNLRKEK